MKTAFLVLGMHRSGTSALSGSLIQVGCVPPRNLIPASDYNAKGYYESEIIRRLNDEILASANLQWDDVRALDMSWYSSQESEKFKRKALHCLKSEFPSGDVIVLKDPRICRLTKFWLGVLDSFSSQTVCLHVHRSPLDVAKSLNKRSGMDMGKALVLWLRYVLDAEYSTRGCNRVFTSFENIIFDVSAALESIGRTLEYTWDIPIEDAKNAVEEFVSLDMYHQYHQGTFFDIESLIPECIQDTYEIFNTWVSDGEDEAHYSKLDQYRQSLDMQELCIDIADISNLASMARHTNHACALDELTKKYEVLKHDSLDTQGLLESALKENQKNRYLIRDLEDKHVELKTDSFHLKMDLELRFRELSVLSEHLQHERASTHDLIEKNNREQKLLHDAIEKHSREMMVSARKSELINALIEKVCQFRIDVYKTNIWSKMMRYLLNRQYSYERKTLLDSDLFDENFYLGNNIDLLDFNGSLADHFLQYGARENRDPNKYFSLNYYLENNADVAESGINPVLHYLRYGAAEGRNPHPDFDGNEYLKKYKDVAQSGLNPLVHFIQFGLQEGRLLSNAGTDKSRSL